MNTKKLTQLAMLTSLGLALHIIESFIPNPFIGVAPGAKLGLANIIGLITLVLFGFKYALGVNLLRCFIGGLASGAVSSMMYSMSGAIMSTLLMFLVYKFFKKYFSLIGVSVFGALGHNVAQLTVASLIIHNARMFTYLPFLMLMSVFTGIFIGLTANFTISKTKLHLKQMIGI
ncbi:Gx transporter family protein [Alkaliphilus hydrothermalis]|uniref:Heptaprenyl diphosphate synthase n=1 Tax=Alkaliphilus hydrothermalis TaxID=1482730 RepID=A0ABS2NKV2_9FIRM|nr:Gx transporter family protein [Alkaliphilus hydrothermalis]MBM7613574.1 heptaprenyl diphosphate synthase [Alkaliphilus hydrothermalis]